MRRAAAVACLSAAFLSALSGLAAAQGRAPAELPPSSYTSNQYIDSRGCVFIRAGVDGNTLWVPRVNRSRQPICDRTPTFGGRPLPLPEALPAPEVREAAVPPAQRAPEAAPVVRVQPPARVAPEPVVRTRPAPVETVAAPRSAPEPRVISGAPTVGGNIVLPGQAVTVYAPPPPPRATAVPPVRYEAPLAYGAPTVGGNIVLPGDIASEPAGVRAEQRRILRQPMGQRSPAPLTAMRQAPASAPEVTELGRVVDASRVSRNARIVPSHLYRPGLLDGVSVPKGMKPAWTDDRLNPYRAHQTLAGRDQMALVWTNTLPRRLVDRHSGKDVTAKNPRLIYPFTDMAAQRAYLSSKGKTSAAETVRTPRISSKSSPKAAPAAAVKRFVQVGTYAEPGNADAAMARLRSAGLPVASQKLTRGGKTLKVVYAGPFRSDDAARKGLSAAQRAGFGSAAIR